jgi:hypothetical protein
MLRWHVRGADVHEEPEGRMFNTYLGTTSGVYRLTVGRVVHDFLGA